MINNSRQLTRTRPYLLREDDFIHINVSGTQYETFRTTLDRFPLTLLGNAERRMKHFVPSKNCFFFDRNCKCFEAILYYFQSGGSLLRPANVPMCIFINEVNFYDLGEDVIKELKEKEGFDYKSKEDVDLPKNKWQLRIWQLFEEPDSSQAARLVACFSITIIAISIVLFCMETMPMFHVETSVMNKTTGYENLKGKATTPHSWFILEICCISWFTIEYIIRFLSSPNKWKFLTSFLNFIDLVAILPYFIILSVAMGHKSPMIRVIRLVRVFRIFKLSRHSDGLQVLGYTLRASISELCMLTFFLIIAVILFSSAIYYAEHDENGRDFESIPDAFWYCVVTMTTVGYGDKAPKTFVGKLIGSLCAVSGVLTIALPVPVIVANFEYFYKMARVKGEECLQDFMVEPEESDEEKSLDIDMDF